MTDSPRSSSVLVTAVIIGRAGSKGFPHKNAQLLADRPLVEYSIQSAAAATCVSRIILTTDCLQMIEAASAVGGVEIIERPVELASDTATVDAAVRHALQHASDDAETVVILYANVPLRPTGLIDRAVRFLDATGADSVQSYAAVGKYHPYWESTLAPDSGIIQPYIENTVYRRQDLPPLFIPDGGVIAVRRAALMLEVEGEPHAFLGTDRRGIENPPGSVVDIDTPIDLLVAEAILKFQRSPTPVLSAVESAQHESVGSP